MTAQTSQQIGADGVDGVERVVGVKVQRVDEGERRGRPADLGHRNSTVEGDDPVRLVGQQLVIELHDLRPVRGEHIRWCG